MPFITFYVFKDDWILPTDEWEERMLSATDNGSDT